MTFYYLVFAALLFLAFVYPKLSAGCKCLVIIFFISAFTFVYGFRFEVGVDWFNYVKKYALHIGKDYKLNTFEIGYFSINWVSGFFGFGYQGVVFIATFMFITLTFLALYQMRLNPFLFLLVSGPVYLVLVAVNLNRQSIAIGAFLYSICFLIEGRKFVFLLLIVFAASFHLSALLFLPLFFIRSNKKAIPFFVLIFIPVMYAIINYRYARYFDGSIKSYGYLLRLGYLFFPCAVLYFNRKRYILLNGVELRLCYFVLFSFPALIALSLFSTAMADRATYYFIALSVLLVMVLFDRNNNKMKFLFSYSMPILFFSTYLIFFIWSFYSPNADSYMFKHLFF